MSVRRYVSNREKIAYVVRLNEWQSNGGSLRAFCREVGLDTSQLRRWRRNWHNLAGGRPNALSTHVGRRSTLAAIEEALVQWIFEMRQRGMAVSVSMVEVRATQLLPSLRHRSRDARTMAVRRFLNAHRFVIRASTHESQRDPSEVCGEAIDFIFAIRRVMSYSPRQLKYIINMDQTPIFFSMQPSTTLAQVGQRTINVRTSTSSTMRITVALSVTASGEMLTPLIVYKGKPGARIARQLATYPAGPVYCCQDRAWMDEQVMIRWVKEVLAPFVSAAPPGVIPLLILDSYRCHLMSSVVDLIEDIGVQVEHIPGGCTSLCQPVDVGIGKPLKDRVRRQWEAWMLEQGPQSIFRHPSRETVATWTINSLSTIGVDIVQNAWRHHDYSYFP